jgi:RluA family pseudouridine synthase
MIPILFENDDILAINKAEGMLCIPGRDGKEQSIVEQLSEQYGTKMYVVHRLDREVSGVMLYAKNAQAHRYLNGLFETRQIHKTYLLAAHGIFAEQSGTIDAPLREFGSGRMGVDEKTGKPSSTRYRVLAANETYSLAQAFPLTGRRHQIRVHLYSIGHSIVGDMKYGDKTLQQQFPRLMLHAYSLAFDLPNKEPLSITVVPPESYTNALETLKLPSITPEL